MSNYAQLAVPFIISSLFVHFFGIFITIIVYNIHKREFNEIVVGFDKQVRRNPKLPLLYWSQLGYGYLALISCCFDILCTGLMIWLIIDDEKWWGLVILLIIFGVSIVALLSLFFSFIKFDTKKYGKLYNHWTGGKQFQLYFTKLDKPLVFVELIDCNTMDKRQTYNTLMDQNIRQIKRIKASKRKDEWKMGKFSSLYVWMMEFYLNIDVNDCILGETGEPITKEEYSDIIENNFLYLWIN